ncbi:MAG: hypothetical protein H6880_11105 [Rhodobiaceae bacterium]|nr:hypothetical protein [Rhodobiaceae bacterium]
MKGNEIRARVARIVADPRTAEALRPWYGQWCKRPGFHDEYLQAFKWSNVELVDTQGRGIERIMENAVVVDGVAYEVDCLVFATGFEAATSYTRRSECEFHGRGGKALSEHWSAGMSTLHGFLTHDFPNCLHMGLTQSGRAFHYTCAVNGQSRHVAYLVKSVIERGAKSIEPTVEAEQDYVALVSAPGPMRKCQDGRTPGYYNVEGKSSGDGFLDNQYPEGAVPFFRMLQAWRDEGDLAGMNIRQAAPSMPGRWPGGLRRKRAPGAAGSAVPGIGLIDRARSRAGRNGRRPRTMTVEQLSPNPRVAETDSWWGLAMTNPSRNGGT